MERPVDMRAKKDLSRIALEGLGPNPGREANLFRREFLEQNKDDQNQRPGGGFGAPASNATIIPGKGMEPPRLTPESQEWALKNFEQSKLLIQALKDLRKGK
jgi:hypothetical protein